MCANTTKTLMNKRFKTVLRAKNFAPFILYTLYVTGKQDTDYTANCK